MKGEGIGNSYTGKPSSFKISHPQNICTAKFTLGLVSVVSLSHQYPKNLLISNEQTFTVNEAVKISRLSHKTAYFWSFSCSIPIYRIDTYSDVLLYSNTILNQICWLIKFLLIYRTIKPDYPKLYFKSPFIHT